MNKRRVRSAVPPVESSLLPRLTAEQERALIARARAGEDVRDQIILSLQRRVCALAAKYAHPDEQEEYCDLVNSANVALLKRYTQALNSPNPYAYLLCTARSTLINYCKGYGEHTQRERVPTLSLEKPQNNDGASLTDSLSTGQTFVSTSVQEATSALLHQAISSLPEKQRQVIERHYGFGYTPEPLNSIKKETSPTRARSMNAFYHHKKALATLRHALTPLFPQYAGGDLP